VLAFTVVVGANAPARKQVRKTPSWPRSWANFSLLQLYSHRNTAVCGPTCTFWANLTPFSLQPAWEALDRGRYNVRPGEPLLISIADHGYYSGEQHLQKVR
jgi:hypothetical protein